MSVPRWILLVGALLLQVALTLTIRELPVIATAQAGAILLVGMYGVARQNMVVTICAIAYIPGCEVLWRQVRAPVPYQAAPYLVAILSGLVVLFVLRRLGKDSRLALLYMALLLPASVATVRTAGSEAREIISFALSGPIALALFVAFTSQVRIAPALYRRVLWITLIGTVGPLTAAVTFFRRDLAAVGSDLFTGQSNFSASGGFGPVQVSSVLSLGIMASIFLIVTERDRMARVVASIVGVALSVQTLLTFSRGGSFSVGIAIAALLVMQARNRRVRNRILAIAAVALTLSYFLLFPWLEEITGGQFEKRFSDTQSSRTELAANDTEIFARNILLGVGPGMSKYQRLTYQICQIRSDRCASEQSSHTEFTRLLGEHGIPGIAAIVLLCVLAWSAFRRAGPGREFAVAWIAWTIAQMFYANLRIVAVPFAFGLAFLRFTAPLGQADRSDDPADRSTMTGVGAESSSIKLASGPTAPRGHPHSVGSPHKAKTDPLVPDAVIPPSGSMPLTRNEVR